MAFNRISQFVLGTPHDPTDPVARRQTQLTAMLAWAGLGASGLSAACYGPEKSFIALAGHPELGAILAIIVMATVAIITFAYSQMFAIFPNGGGSYQITSQLLGPEMGLVSGSALLVEYVLAIAVSLASGTDAMFSLLPSGLHDYKLPVELAITVLLIVLNLRGLRVATQAMFPVVAAFLFVHAILILYGIATKAPQAALQMQQAFSNTLALSQTSGVMFVVALLVRAYSLGGSTYAGVEAVSNNANLLKEPRVQTGRLTMLYVAITLAFTASGLILLYSLWGAQPVSGQTLNATVFVAIIQTLGLGAGPTHLLIVLALGLEAAILLVAANSALIFAPTLLANMASDSWLPHQFRNLSVRLVRQNGVLFIGICALAILIWTHGDLSILVVFFSINVFLSLVLAKTGMLRYWWQQRGKVTHWLPRIFIVSMGLLLAACILVATLTERFFNGGWATACLTLIIIGACLNIRHHYRWVTERRRDMDRHFALTAEELDTLKPVASRDDAATAILLVTNHWGPAIHTLLWIQRLFPEHFHNFMFVSVIEMNARAIGAPEALPRLNQKLEVAMAQLEGFCAKCGLHAGRAVGYGTDPVEELERLVQQIVARQPNCVIFGNKLILPSSHRLTEWLHNKTTLDLQRRLHSEGIPLIILPIKLD